MSVSESSRDGSDLLAAGYESNKDGSEASSRM